MNRNGPLISKSLSSKTRVRKIGGIRWNGKNTCSKMLPTFEHAVALLALAWTLSACQSQTNSPDYPDLRSVSSSSDTSYPLEERRRIVRDLIGDRDAARHKKAIVRHRSGLSDTPPPAAATSTETRAEDIIREAPIEGGQVAEKPVESESERAYRDRTQFDDGTLNDFIRRLKRDTAPAVPAVPLVDEERSSDQSLAPNPQSWRFQKEPATTLTQADSSRISPYQPVLLLAFAPSVLRDEGPMAVRLAADDAEPGFFCSYLGWMVAWSNTCLVDESGISSKNDDVAAEVDDGKTGDQESPIGSNEPVDDKKSSGRGEEDAPDQSPNKADDEAIASEDIDDDALLPVTGMLDRLRDLIRSRRSSSNPSSTDPKSLSYEADELKPPEDPGPTLPASRPDVEKDLRIVRNDKVFEFTRTPRPAFKPLPPEPKTVIFPPDVPRPAKNVVFRPAARPPLVIARQDVVRGDAKQIEPEQDEDLLAAKTLDDAKAETPNDLTPPATVDLAEPEETGLLDSQVILFDPGSARLPIGIEIRLEAMLDEARAKDGKLFIVSEAGVGSLAMERARSVGLALVRLGATADVIEYDIVVDRTVDQVRLLLKSAEKTDRDQPLASDLDKIK